MCKEMNWYFQKCTSLSCLLVIGALCCVYGSAPTHLPLFFTNKCSANGNVSLVVTMHFRDHNVPNCQLVLKSASGHSLQFKLNGKENITIHNLSVSTLYTVYADCVLQNSAKYQVTTDSCRPKNVLNNKNDESPPLLYKEESVFSATALDVVLGVIFCVMAIVIVAVTSYYLYHRFQRRRHLQQFLRAPHTDPFESLQSYMEVET